MNSSEHEETSRIPVAYLILGYENNKETLINVIRSASTMVCTVIDAVQAVVNTSIHWIPQEVSRARSRGVKFMTITDVTKQNLPHCKEIMARIDEFRHLDRIGVNFVVTDYESVVMAPNYAPREEATMQVIHSNSESVVEYKRICFNSLWDKAVPAQPRINELEWANTATLAPVTPRKLIDRIYGCTKCGQSFLDYDEVNEHRKLTGHGHYREFSIN